MTQIDYKKKLQDNARNRYYKLAGILADHEGESMSMEAIAREVGYTGKNDLNKFLKAHGDWLAEKYGKLPFVVTNGKTLKKYMEGCE
ncbi:MAG: hypothetical protein J6N51_06885 [Selenomonas sp.]|nr:hypothetical protein [Selenomonas sp.]